MTASKKKITQISTAIDDMGCMSGKGTEMMTVNTSLRKDRFPLTFQTIFLYHQLKERLVIMKSSFKMIMHHDMQQKRSLKEDTSGQCHGLQQFQSN